MTLENLVFVGFNSRVAALDRRTGELVWKWKCPKGKGFVTLLLDADRLLASVQGYTYCLDARTGQQLWFNELSGFGHGVASLASVRGGSTGALLGEAKAEQARATAAAAAAGAGASAG